MLMTVRTSNPLSLSIILIVFSLIVFSGSWAYWYTILEVFFKYIYSILNITICSVRIVGYVLLCRTFYHPLVSLTST